MNKLEIAKGVTSFVVGLGVSKITGSIIKNNVPMETLIDKIEIASAALVIGSMASASTKKYTDAKIDEIVTSVDKAKAKINEARTEKES